MSISIFPMNMASTILGLHYYDIFACLLIEMDDKAGFLNDKLCRPSYAEERTNDTSNVKLILDHFVFMVTTVSNVY